MLHFSTNSFDIMKTMHIKTKRPSMITKYEQMIFHLDANLIKGNWQWNFLVFD